MALAYCPAGHVSHTVEVVVNLDPAGHDLQPYTSLELCSWYVVPEQPAHAWLALGAACPALHVLQTASTPLLRV